MQQVHEQCNEFELTTGFTFQRRRGRIDWRKIDSANLETIVNDVDIDTLQEHVEAIAFADITEDLRYLSDNAFLKLFRLAQLTIEYLLFVQDYLMKQSGADKAQIATLATRLGESTKVAACKDEELRALRKEYRHIRKVASAYERIMGMAGQVPGGPGSTTRQFGCAFCNSSFVSELHLQAHIGRRHPNHAAFSDLANTQSNNARAQEDPPTQTVLNGEQIEKMIHEKTSVVMEKWLSSARQLLKESLDSVSSKQHPPPPPVIIQQPAVDTAVQSALLTQEVSQRMLAIEGKLESVKAMMQVDFVQRSTQQESSRQQSARRPYRPRVGPLEPMDSDTDSIPVYGKPVAKENIQDLIRKSFDGLKIGLLDEVKRNFLPMQNAISSDNIEQPKHAPSRPNSDVSVDVDNAAIVERQEERPEVGEKSEDVSQVEAISVHPDKPDIESQPKPASSESKCFGQSEPEIDVVSVYEMLPNGHVHDRISEGRHTRQNSSEYKSDVIPNIDPVDDLMEACFIPFQLEQNDSSSITGVQNAQDMLQKNSIDHSENDFKVESMISPEATNVVEVSQQSQSSIEEHRTNSNEASDAKMLDQNDTSQIHTVFQDAPYCHVRSRTPHSSEFISQEKNKIEALVETCTQNDYDIMEAFIAESGYDRTPTLLRMQTLMEKHYKPLLNVEDITEKCTDIGPNAIDSLPICAHISSSTQSPRYETEPRSGSVNSDPIVEDII